MASKNKGTRDASVGRSNKPVSMKKILQDLLKLKQNFYSYLLSSFSFYW